MKAYNLKQFQEAARDFARKLAPLSDRAAVVGLYGDLGSGKTTFTQAVGRALGITDSIQSPTFVIIKSYKLKAKSYKLLIHVDAYRLKSGEELRKLGFEELLADPKNLILVEWADRVASVLPKNHVKIHFRFMDEQTRELVVKKSKF
jgi:tRNA threonylcarbamoyladenosine biosynthesis protein TsaE